jgi:hypothetical protein
MHKVRVQVGTVKICIAASEGAQDKVASFLHPSSHPDIEEPGNKESQMMDEKI